jgi:hypothetical protein
MWFVVVQVSYAAADATTSAVSRHGLHMPAGCESYL